MLRDFLVSLLKKIGLWDFTVHGSNCILLWDFIVYGYTMSCHAIVLYITLFVSRHESSLYVALLVSCYEIHLYEALLTRTRLFLYRAVRGCCTWLHVHEAMEISIYIVLLMLCYKISLHVTIQCLYILHIACFETQWSLSCKNAVVCNGHVTVPFNSPPIAVVRLYIIHVWHLGCIFRD